MQESTPQRFHFLLQAFFLLGFALYIAYLVKSNSLHYYLAPRTEKWIHWCPIPLGLMAVFTAYRAIAPSEDNLCGCEHAAPQSLLKRIVVYGLLIMPLAFGTLLPNRPLGSSAAATKGFSLTPPLQGVHIPKSTTVSTEIPSLEPETTSATKAFKAPDRYNEEFAELAGLLYTQPVINVTPDIFSETIGAIELFKQDFIGKKISLTGFVYKDEAIRQTSGTLAVGRFLVLCCTADALPFGVLVKTPASAASLEQNTWIKVTGSINVEKVNGKEVLRIDASQIMHVAEPEVPYVYPSADSVTAFKKKQAALITK